ncbi:MAG TPA: sterol desaturase family protein [Acidimicrobiales bacterium]|jgi:sterol desaturase/sphingolipid hydroxylase (fatty acid hydroxylase superfamily)|nr:sterol desaturase family protein [Acidimicrobiales bacterium]HMS89051.1 sterol desaturase family protein [Acidimicrobiales bacterium]HRA34270.1 sterol desaturase family protein [Acidimicrobiales bacterium]
MGIEQIAAIAGAFTFGAFLWTFAEYLLHRFAMHHLHGRGIMSREHLEHHVTSQWHFDVNHILSWTGMLLVGFAGFAPVAAWLASWTIGIAIAVGWACGYFHYEARHALAHLRNPTTRYTRWVARHHFHHHFGHPMANHGVSVPWWDHVFGTYERPVHVRVPRRLVLPWMLDDDGQLKAEHADDYVLVGSADPTDRTRQLDRARAFASTAPID